MATQGAPHIPVMLSEMLDYLNPKDGGVYVDATFGAGGYSKAILSRANCQVFAIDRDPSVVPFFESLNADFPGRIHLLEGQFGNMEEILTAEKITQLDGIVLDIGVSSMQIDQAERGFSFQKDGPLDMRMSSQGTKASDMVNHLPEEELANIIYHYGGERKSRRIARAIVGARPLHTTKELADVIRAQFPAKPHPIDPATRTFQALRIWINDELQELTSALNQAEHLLAPGGRLVVVTFHSLEDKIVKHYFQEKSGKTSSGSRHIPDFSPQHASEVFTLLTRKPVAPSKEEVDANPRARSAKLRAAEKQGGK